MYDSEIWACSLSKKASDDGLFDFSQIFKSFYSEKLHINFGKYNLEVYKTSSNFAVFQNLGDIPFKLAHAPIILILPSLGPSL